jgi:hypothetical protein
MNNKPGDKWNLEAYDETTELPYPEDFLNSLPSSVNALFS